MRLFSHLKPPQGDFCHKHTSLGGSGVGTISFSLASLVPMLCMGMPKSGLLPPNDYIEAAAMLPPLVSVARERNLLQPPRA
ncbi:hypothetical protein [Brasilonema bromeliae]|uniref:hypothetical protein n=1 Tax=Brasilonema bromeliae TaxID=383615 RepID=UPI00145F18ED|nr:hypothetical protein [Brasilonema bromeliae]